MFVCAAGHQPARPALGSKPHRRTIVHAVPIAASPQAPSPWLSSPLGRRLMLLKLSQPSAPNNNCQCHYPHSAWPHRANLSRGFLP